MAARLKKLPLKKLKDQIIVITGATSGIGLATARHAAERGAWLVISSRNRPELSKLSRELREKGVEVLAVAADVADKDAVQRIADRAVERFGGFDTWINNAGVSVYGRLDEVHMLEKRRVFDVNFWGVVHGCRAALPVLRKRGGALINLGSAVSERAIPLQGIYVASKQAIKGYTDTLRMELEESGDPVSVSLIRPAAIDTPYTQHAANHLGEEAKNPPPVYSADVVARAILDAASHPRRDVFVGGAARMFSLMESFFPRATDYYMERAMFDQQRSGKKLKTGGGVSKEKSLFRPPRHEGEQSGHYEGHVARTSLYTSLSLHPVRALLMGLSGAGLLAFARRRGVASPVQEYLEAA